MSTIDEIFATGATRKEKRAARRRALRALRPQRVPAGALTALALTLAGGLTAAEVVSALAGRPLRAVPYDRLAGITWGDRATMIAGAGTLVTGLALAAAGLLPGRARLIPVETADPHLVIGMTRRGLRNSLAAAVAAVEGVERARVRLRRGRVHIVATTGSLTTDGLVSAIRRAASARLADTGVLYGHEVRVRLHRKQI
ncbi:DUF6286 domain-containing protein [Bailinhaonella thermotolerans]|uniref:DUF6286 domain-containing protein n=1 Tax=Bailinhaonella thermotolerans TaxID=1070861 RepID=A0A3A4AVL0_9ACTN|nr:DUF6286 domain-containing protein [Bailinhaonella thermotolerans]RJL32387.1 hypothetical protein D5H75_12630 [Bailinhaonella thermotolerans]